MVGERGFEPPAPASRRQCSTRLSYSPTEYRPGRFGHLPLLGGAPIALGFGVRKRDSYLPLFGFGGEAARGACILLFPNV